MKNTINAEIKRNTEKNGIEIYFSAIPSDEIRDSLKNAGFRWSRFAGAWYAKDTAENMTAAETITGAAFDGAMSDGIGAKRNGKRSAELAPIWERVQVDSLPAYGTNNELKQAARASGECYDKAAAKAIRAHLRARFPEFRFSVTSGGAGYLMSCAIRIVGGCYDADADITKAVNNYAQKLHDAYDDDDGDTYADYGAHHDLYGYANISAWNYQKTEPTAEQLAAIDAFAKAKQADDERKAAEANARYLAEEEERRKAAEEWEKQDAENKKAVEEIEAAAIVEEIPAENQYYFYAHEARKAATLAELDEDIKAGNAPRVMCCAVRSVTLPAAMMLKFRDLLSYDFSFLDGQGGSRTNDARINSDLDYMHMTKAERDSVQWFSLVTVVKVAETGAPIFYINPEGYAYARYVYTRDGGEDIDAPDAGTVDGCDAMNAERIEDTSADIIAELDMIGQPEKWIASEEYKISMMLHFPPEKLTRGIIQQVTIEPLKKWLYSLYDAQMSLDEQAAKAQWMTDSGEIDDILICSCGFLGVDQNAGKVNSVIATAGKMYIDFIPNGKKPKIGEQYIMQFSASDSFVVLAGVSELPDSLLWETKDRGNGVITKMSKYASFDRSAIVDIRKWAIENGVKIVVDRSEVGA